MEIKTKVNTFLVHLMCDKCDGGEMMPTGIALLSNPPQYPHKCNKCGHQVNVTGNKYPFIKHEVAD